MNTRLFYPVLCSSVIFYYLVFWLGIGLLARPGAELGWGVLPAFLAFVSLAGVYLVLREVKKETKRWYRGIPHAIVLGVVCFTGPVIFWLYGGKVMDCLFLAFALLPLTSIGFFLSFLDSKNLSLRVLLAVLGGIGIYSIFSSSRVIHGLLFQLQTSWSVVSALEGIYLIFLMPLIGLCYIAAAFLSRE